MNENMNIEELLKKYFDGDTTCEEESQIRAYFMQDDIPSHLEVYKPMFLFMQEEIDERKHSSLMLKVETKGKPLKRAVRKCIYIGSIIAASAAVLAGVYVKIHNYEKEKNACYAVIDGHCVTDKNVVKAFADASFKEVSTSKTEILDEMRGD